MFHVGQPRASRGFQFTIGSLALLSLTALVVTAWLLADFHHEQETLAKISAHLPVSDIAAARELAGELRLQERLSILLIVNTLATAAALAVLARAYRGSERSLRAVKVLATDILASMDQGVMTTDQNGVIMSINPRGRELIGAGRAELGSHVRELPTEHAMLEAICREVLERHDTVRDRDYQLARDGHTRWLRAGCGLLRNDRQQLLGTVIHLRDVTEKTLIEQRLRRMERYMGLGSLAAGLRHEIKNPLSALSLHAQLLGEALSEQQPSAEILEMLGVLRTEVARIASVVERFSDFASLSKLHREPVDLAGAIAKLARLLEPQARRQGVRIEVVEPTEPMPRLLADPVGLEQVLLNLAVNALEAMPEGGVLTFRLGRSLGAVRLEVADTGVGIPDDLRERVFDPYFTTRGAGTGMGLAISEKIVRQHNGAIECVSSGAGAVFTVSLPLEEAP